MSRLQRGRCCLSAIRPKSHCRCVLLLSACIAYELTYDLLQRKMMLPAEVQFYEDVHLFVWRPRGVLDETAINKVLGSLEDLEGKLEAPFNRFSDTLAADE